MKKLRISSSLTLHGVPVGDIGQHIRNGLAFHKKIGFDAADFPMGYLRHMGENWKSCMVTAAEDAQKAGLRFEVCHLPYGISMDPTPEEAESFSKSVIRAMDAAMILGVDHAVLHPNTTTQPLSEFDRQVQYDRVMAHLSPFAEYAAKIGLSIVVENMRIVPQSYPVHRYCGDPEELCEIADALGIGVCWDFGHAHINGLKQSEALQYVGKRLKVLHINDNFAGDDLHVPPFVGTNNWKDSMEGLSAIGFDGLFNYEVGSARVPLAAKESFAQYLVSAAHTLLDMM